jgi:hypothetical protein
VANIDKQMLDVIEVIKHVGNFNRLTDIKYLMKWSDNTSSMMSYSTLKSNKVLHHYLIEKIFIV